MQQSENWCFHSIGRRSDLCDIMWAVPNSCWGIHVFDCGIKKWPRVRTRWPHSDDLWWPALEFKHNKARTNPLVWMLWNTSLSHYPLCPIFFFCYFVLSSGHRLLLGHDNILVLSQCFLKAFVLWKIKKGNIYRSSWSMSFLLPFYKASSNCFRPYAYLRMHKKQKKTMRLI